MKKHSVKSISQDKGVWGHTQSERASKILSDNPPAPLSGDFAHFMGSPHPKLETILS
jgi:hypothetical protein